jgi:hypothetical protein
MRGTEQHIRVLDHRNGLSLNHEQLDFLLGWSLDVFEEVQPHRFYEVVDLFPHATIGKEVRPFGQLLKITKAGRV